MATTNEALDVPIRRAKLRPPQPGGDLVARPRLTIRLDRGWDVPLTLIAAPAGFGKTTLLAEWAGSHTIPMAWVTADAGDRDLRRFLTHVVAAINMVVPGAGASVLDLFRRPHAVPAVEVGASLADELLDLPRDLNLVVDDFQLAASAAVESFLAGLLQTPAPSFHLLLATRNDPALPLARMRLHGQVNELRAADLRFSDEEAGTLLAASGHNAASPALIAALQQQTGGWVAGLRLATMAAPAIEDLSRIADVVASGEHLMDFLVEEVLAAQTATTQEFLLRTAIVDRISPPLADALVDQAPPGGSRALIERLVRESLFVEASNDDGEWFRYHPLFRSLLLHQLEIRLTAPEIAGLHARAGAWFATRGLLDQAISHHLAAGDTAGAAALVEQRVLAALDREDWNTVAHWLDLLPEAVVLGRPRLLLAKGWVSHFSGRSVPIRAMLADLDALLSTQELDPDARKALEAERDALAMVSLLHNGRDPDAAVAFAQRAVEQIPRSHRLAAGLATFGFGCALQATGRTDEAIRFLTAAAEREEARIDAGSIRSIGGLMFVHRQAGNYRACEEAADHVLSLAERHRLPVATGWGHWILGWLAYQRDELETAIAHFSAIVADHQRVHLHTTCEAMFGLALAYQARAMPIEKAATVRRLLEIVLDANALEYLPLIRGFEARLALIAGERQRAIAWLAMEDAVSIESNSFDAFDHPFLTRINVLLAEGSDQSLARAWRSVEELRAYAEAHHHQGHLVETLALSALVLAAQGSTEAALAELTRSLELASPAGFIRPYLELGPDLVPLLERLAVRVPPAPFLQRLLGAVKEPRDPDDRDAARVDSARPAVLVLELLTARETEVLGCLHRRLSYREIGEELFISPQTVKSHVANIYGKLGVGNRRQALAKALSLGWTPPD